MFRRRRQRLPRRQRRRQNSSYFSHFFIPKFISGFLLIFSCLSVAKRDSLTVNLSNNIPEIVPEEVEKRHSIWSVYIATNSLVKKTCIFTLCPQVSIILQGCKKRNRDRCRSRGGKRNNANPCLTDKVGQACGTRNSTEKHGETQKAVGPPTSLITLGVVTELIGFLGNKKARLCITRRLTHVPLLLCTGHKRDWLSPNGPSAGNTRTVMRSAQLG